MSAACLLVGTATLMLASPGFELTWQHSVERIAWRESWTIESGALHLTEAAIKGSGAGMDPGPGARLEEGWWVWDPDLPPLGAVTLAASGATGTGWLLCSGGRCTEIGAEPGEALRLAPCPD